jgi:hypothetical protein
VQEKNLQLFAAFTNSVIDQDIEDNILPKVSIVLKEFKNCFLTEVKFANLPSRVASDWENLNHSILFKDSSPQLFSHNSMYLSTAELNVFKK